MAPCAKPPYPCNLNTRTTHTYPPPKLLAASALFALLLLSQPLSAIANIDCAATICKPGYSKQAGLFAGTCTTEATVHETGGCQECCAAAAYACSDTTCAAGFTNIGGYVDACDACPGTGNNRNSCAAVTSGLAGCASCCQSRACSSTTSCAFGYRNTGNITPPSCADCSQPNAKCSNAGGCQECCEPAASTFPTCQASLGSSSAQQALTTSDAIWALRSTVPSARFTSTRTGLCFSINLRNACARRTPITPLHQACCLSPKPPAILQLKIPSATVIGSGYATRKSTLGLLDRCRLAYGAASATSNGLKGFPRALDVHATASLPGTAPSRVFNLPLPALSSSTSALDFCVFTNAVVDPSTQLDCSWEILCGLKDGSVPDATTDTPPLDDRSLGCEVRLIGGSEGRRNSLPCCTVPVGITAFDGTRERVDCSNRCGGVCPKCAVGSACSSDSQCTSGVCSIGNSCAATTCEDGRFTTGESGIDCGGGCPLSCLGGSCRANADCKSGICASICTCNQGLSVSYYDLSSPNVLPNFSVLTAFLTTTVPSINYASTSGNFANSNRADNFGALFTGWVDVPTAGSWTFYTNSDDGSKLWINITSSSRQLLVSNDGLHGMTEVSGTVTLSAKRHFVTVEFFERGGGAGLIVSWLGPGTAKQPIPAVGWTRFDSDYSVC